MTDLFSTDQTDHTQITDEDLAKYIGPGGKFYREDASEMLKTLAKAKIESDRYVSTLEQGRDQLREDYLKVLDEAKTGPKVKELFDQYMQQLQNSNNSNTQNVTDVGKPSLELDDVKNLFMTLSQETEMKRRQEANTALVESKLRETYGEDYASVFRKKINEQGLTMEWAKQTAASYPQVLLKQLGVGEQQSQQFQAPPQSSRFVPTGDVKSTHDWNYYEKMRKEQPDVYWNPKTQVEMHQNAGSNPKFYG